MLNKHFELRPESPFFTGNPPVWASEWGIDEFGSYAGFTVSRVASGKAVEVHHRFRWIPAGKFVMGSPSDEWGRYDDEGPELKIHLEQGFWLGETPVTQELYEVLMGNNPSQFAARENLRCPVERVNLEDVRRFCEKLQEQVPGLVCTLPCEAEWEYACRAGTTTATWIGELSEKTAKPMLDRIAWHNQNSGGSTKPVKGKEANPFGLYDVLGNVWEWTASERTSSLSESSVKVRLPWESGARRVRRGGSWASVARLSRAAYRSGLDPQYRYGYLGFRLLSGQAAPETGK